VLRRELFTDEVIDDLLGRVEDGGLSLTGPGGFLPELVKSVLERGMQVELTDHLGYDKGDPAGRGSGNSRNGTSPKTVASEVGQVRLDQPRDRNGSFASALVPKGARRLGGLEEQVISCRHHRRGQRPGGRGLRLSGDQRRRHDHQYPLHRQQRQRDIVGGGGARAGRRGADRLQRSVDDQ